MRANGWLCLTVTLAMSMTVAGCDTGPQALTVERAVVRLSPNPAAPSVAYFTLKGGPVDDRLIDVLSPVAVRAELHESMTMNNPSTSSGQGMATMKPIEGGVPVPAGSTIKFEQGGKHVMLFGVNARVKPDETMALVFTFASGSKYRIQASVRRPGQVL